MLCLVQKECLVRQLIRNCKALVAAMVTSSLLLSGALTAAPQTVAVLDKGEPFEAMVFHGEWLFVGKSRREFNSEYSVEIYDRAHQMLQSVRLPHAVTFMYPYDTNAVIAVGTAFQPNLTHWSIIRRSGAGFSVSTRQIPMNAWAHRWLGTAGGREFFSDPGGNQNDPARDRDFNLASQTIFSMSAGGSPRYLPVRVRLPLSGIRVNGGFFMVSGQSIGQPRSFLYWVADGSSAPQAVFPDPRNTLRDIVQIPGLSKAAVVEAGTGTIHFVNTNTRSLEGEISVGGSTTMLTAGGQCLAVGDPDNRRVHVVSLKGEPQVVWSWDIDMGEGDFKHLAKLAVDASAGKLYARSNFPCNPMMEQCVKDWNRVIAVDLPADVAASCR